MSKARLAPPPEYSPELLTPIEDEPMAVGRRHLAGQGWHPARHA